MNSLPRRAVRFALRFKLEYLAPVIVGAIFVVVASVLRPSGEDVTPEPKPQPVIVVGTTPMPTKTPSQAPAVRVINLEIRPAVITLGQEATLVNGICNDTERPLNVQLYLGAQLDGDPLVAPTIDLIGKDTPEGRVRRNLEPGCLGAEPITAAVDSRLTPGKWRLHLVVMVTGDGTPIVKSSPVFEVRPAP